jgi:hypothetical protein
VADCAGLAIERAQKADDEVTADLFIKTAHGLDRALWFLEATLEPAPEPKKKPEPEPDEAAAPEEAAA